VPVADAITPASRVTFVPFLLRPGEGHALLGRADGSEWIEVDPVGAAVVDELDRGATLSEVQARIEANAGQSVDVPGFVGELARLGWIAEVGVDSVQRSTRRSADRAASPWPWRVVSIAAILALAEVAVALGSRRLPLPRGSDVLLATPSVPLSVGILFTAVLGVLTIHELAHVLVGRLYGLTPRVSLGRRAAFLVAQTDLTGVWALPPGLRWRPVAAGPIADAGVLAAGALALQHAPLDSTIGQVARMVAAIAAAQLLWQFQWYLRTDGYFLLSLLTGAPNLRETSWDWVGSFIRARPEGSDGASTPRATRATTVYLLSLPLAAAATAILWADLILPFFARIVAMLGGS
jgi:hypothetical protein